MSRIRLILIPPSAALPAPCLTLDAHGAVLTRGVLELGSGFAPEPMRTVAVVPGADVLIRWLALPSGSSAQVATTALHLLRDDLAAPAERLTAALGPVAAPGGRRLVAVAGRPLLQTWSDYLASLGLRADVMIPDSLILPEPAEEGALTAAVFGADLALRGRELALSLQPDLAEAVAAGRTLARIDRADEIERLLAAAALNPPINLLAGAGRRIEAARFQPRRSASTRRPAPASRLIGGFSAAAARRRSISSARSMRSSTRPAATASARSGWTLSASSRPRRARSAPKTAADRAPSSAGSGRIRLSGIMTSAFRPRLDR